MKSTFHVAVISLTLAFTLQADEKVATLPFKLTIVSKQQHKYDKADDPKELKGKSVPVIYCPSTFSSPKGDVVPVKAEDASFDVSIQNASKAAVTIDRDTSDWYNCLTFEITDAKECTFSIHRDHHQIWFANVGEQRTFDPSKPQIIAVNLFSGRYVWVCTPSDSKHKLGDGSHTANVKIKVIFQANAIAESEWMDAYLEFLEPPKK